MTAAQWGCLVDDLASSGRAPSTLQMDHRPGARMRPWHKGYNDPDPEWPTDTVPESIAESMAAQWSPNGMRLYVVLPFFGRMMVGKIRVSGFGQVVFGVVDVVSHAWVGDVVICAEVRAARRVAAVTLGVHGILVPEWVGQ